MVRDTVRRRLRIVAAVAFWIAAIISWWTVIEDGLTVMRLLPAVCVTLAGVIWLVMVVSPRENLR